MMEIIKSLSGWQIFGYTYVTLSIIANVVFTIVITIGGIGDLRYLFKELNKEPDDLKNNVSKKR